jgi:hypothetical protein
MDVAAEHGIHPDAGMLAHDDVTDELSGIVDVTGFWKLRGDAFVRADHGFIRCCWGAKSQHIMERLPESVDRSS